MAKRSVLVAAILTFVVMAASAGKAEAFCGSRCYYGGYACGGPMPAGASNCGLGWGACGAAWWMGQPYTGCAWRTAPCASRHHLFPIFGRYGWLHLCPRKHAARMACARGGCGSFCGDGCWASGGGCWNGPGTWSSSCSGWSTCDGGGCVDGGIGGGCVDGSCLGGMSGGVVEGMTGEMTYEGGNIIGEQPGAGAEEIQEGVPLDQSAATPVHQSVYRTTSKTTTKQDGSAAFEKGLMGFRQGKMREALIDFDRAARAEPKNAFYQYHRAIALYDLGGENAAQQALKMALATEAKEPMKNWGKRMERVQGAARVWVETARRNAGLVR